MMMGFDLVVVGGGVLGTFHAYHALKRGLRVALLEKDASPMSATVCNFGQIVPSGLPQGKWQQYGIESTRIYKEIQSQFDISVRQQGSVYIASDDAELGLLEELHTINKYKDYTSILLTKAECLERYPGLKASYGKGGLFFPDEITVEPRIMIGRVLEYLQTLGLVYKNKTQVIGCEQSSSGVIVYGASGRTFQAAKVVICSGSEFKALYPEVFFQSDLEVSKLQMLQTYPQDNFVLPGSILTGLTIRRYESFRECPSFSSLDALHLDSRLKDWGIHILFKQALDGSIILGDSHEYHDAKNADELGFDSRSDINELIVEQARDIFDLPTWTLSHTWAGFYTQCKTKDVLTEELEPNVYAVTGIGGKGMTASPALAQEYVDQLLNVGDGLV
jgi:FAD dependent oxidoreductase TIGR03364